MRICIIAPPWVPVPPPRYGGTEAVLDVLARGLAAAGHDVLLATTGDSTCPVPRSWTFHHAIGVGTGGTGAELRHVFHAYGAAARWDADVVHDHTLAGPLVGGGAVVTTNHGPFSAPELAPLYRTLSARGVPVIAISEHQASMAEATPIAAVIHHGTELDAVAPGLGAGSYALFLGRMTEDKGVDAACRIARAAGVPLRIAAKMSEPHEHEYFKEAVEPLLGGEVEYLGEVDADEKAELLRDACCLLNPIRWPEPFGMVMVESLAAGTPVVARACGSAPEIVRHGLTGFLATDDDELAGLLARVGDLDRAACRDDAERRFSAERMVRDHLVVYERAVEASRPRGQLLAR